MTTPERHWQHYQNANFAFGDTFTFYHKPAIASFLAWMQFLIEIKKQHRKSSNIAKA